MAQRATLKRKASEEHFREMMRETFGDKVRLYKVKDVQVCPKCHSLLWKTDGLDYFVYAIGGHFFIVECKQSVGRFRLSDISDKQRQLIADWTRYTRVYIYLLVIAKGEKHSWMIPAQALIDADNTKSLGVDELDASFAAYRVGKSIPDTHEVYHYVVSFQD